MHFLSKKKKRKRKKVEQIHDLIQMCLNIHTDISLAISAQFQRSIEDYC